MWYKNGEVFNSQQAIRNDNKETSLPHFLSDETIEGIGYIKIIENRPQYNIETQYITEGEIILVNGIPNRQYIINTYTAEEITQRLESLKPKIVSMAQFRGALIITGLKTTVDNYIKNSGDELLINDYEYRTEVQRDWPSFVAMATVLGKTSADIDALLELASGL